MTGLAGSIGAGTVLGGARRNAKLIMGGITLLAFAICLGWGFRVDHLRADWKAKHEALTGEAGTVLAALRTASDNPKLTWKAAPGQVVALGESNRVLKVELVQQNKRINDMAETAKRLKAEAEELQRIADMAEAQRRAALTELSDLAITPGTRSDCLILLREAEDALDIVYEAGL